MKRIILDIPDDTILPEDEVFGFAFKVTKGVLTRDQLHELLCKAIYEGNEDNFCYN